MNSKPIPDSLCHPIKKYLSVAFRLLRVISYGIMSCVEDKSIRFISDLDSPSHTSTSTIEAFLTSILIRFDNMGIQRIM
ncbi:hypothetical protein CEXT_226681 [Caerostris extrusa]|uniref:Maturase K n=1 Tax=Caerostris extrusa TaxID=172846 RepID=A0AAV4M5X5_CAEEX|nr:hypothetical protein CEXT_226681 [Caerostris extrusa]